MTSTFNDNDPISLIRVKQILVNKGISKDIFSPLGFAERYGSQLGFLKDINLVVPYHKIKKLFEEFNVSQEHIKKIEDIHKDLHLLIPKNVNTNEGFYKTITSTKELGELFSEKDKLVRLSKKERNKINREKKQRINAIKNIDEPEQNKAEVLRRIDLIKSKKIIIFDLEFDSNRSNKITEIGYISIDLEKQTFEHNFILLDKKPMNFNPQNMFKASLTEPSKTIITNTDAMIKMQELINNSDFIMAWGGREDLKILKKEGIIIPKTIKNIDLQTFQFLDRKDISRRERQSISTAIDERNINTQLNITSQEKFNNFMNDIIEKDKSIFKKRGKIHHKGNIGLHTAFNDVYAGFLILEDIFSKNNNFQLHFIKNRLNHLVSTHLEKKLNEQPKVNIKKSKNINFS